MRYLIAALGITALACGGSDEAGRQGQQPAPPSDRPAAAAPAATGTVHEVKMELRDGRYIYDPVQLTIRAGDTVRWVNISGGPHNVAFYQDKIPAGAGDVLNAAMPNRLGPWNGPLLTDSLAAYQVSFAGAPAGTYDYFCLPHEALGMKASLTIQP